MAAATFEIVTGVLFVTGSLDRASDQELAQALEKYAKAVAAPNRVVDMSNVRWLAPTGAKALIAAGQETSEKGGSLRVLASRHVLQTLNLLGAKSWLNIESCQSPNPRPGAPEQAGVMIESSAKAGDADLAKTAEPAAAAPASAAPAASAGAPESSAAIPSVAAPAPAVAATPVARPAGVFAHPAEHLEGGAHLLRILLPNRRYSFHLTGGELMMGFVRERIGGSWIMVETAGTRKMLNLDAVQYCEIL